MTKATPTLTKEKKPVDDSKSRKSPPARVNKRLRILLVVVVLAAFVVIAVTVAVTYALVVLKKPDTQEGSDIEVESDEETQQRHQNHPEGGTPHTTTNKPTSKITMKPHQKEIITTITQGNHVTEKVTPTSRSNNDTTHDLPYPPVPNSCERTARDIIGPYYEPGTPLVTRVCSEEPLQKSLIVHGHVLEEGCKKNISNAKIEIWQAGIDGKYKPNCRGHVITDVQGYFRFSTVHPGHYLLDPGSGRYRASHIHYRISHLDYETLVTQQYFTGDNITNQQVPSLMSSVLPINRNETDGDDFVVFNFIL